MLFVFTILAGFTLLSGVAAVSLRNLVHCALCLALTFAGLAAIFLQLGAQFVGLVQVLVYVGAVAILVVFAILLTRNVDVARGTVLSPSWSVGLGVALLVFGCLAGAILRTSNLNHAPKEGPDLTVERIGSQLMTDYVLPLEVIGLLLTAALVGAVLLAMPEKEKG
jgi:NADH-quinone oxidoreductase subunit J